MKIAPQKIHAVSSASFYARSPIASIILCCSLLGGVCGAAAAGDRQNSSQRRDEGGERQARQMSREAQRDEPRQRDDRMAEQRPVDPRSYAGRAEESQRAAQDDSSRRNGRLTPDERRNLRRQINEAGQDIYANPPRR